MCISNKFCEILLKNIRALEKEGFKSSPEKLANILARIDYLKKDLEKYEEIIKKEFISRGDKEIQYVTELKKKVYLSEGNDKTEYDKNAIIKKIPLDSFLNICNIVKKNVETLPKEQQDIIQTHSFITKSTKLIVSIKKMNKEELIEHKEEQL